MRKRFLEHDFHNRNYQECAHTQTNGINQQSTIHDRTDLIGQDLQIRFRNGNEHTKNNADTQQQTKLLLSGKAGTHMGSHGCHCQIRAHAEQSNTQNQHDCTHGKSNQFRGRQGKQRRHCQNIHNRCNGQGRYQCFQNLRFQFLQSITFFKFSYRISISQFR